MFAEPRMSFQTEQVEEQKVGWKQRFSISLSQGP